MGGVDFPLASAHKIPVSSGVLAVARAPIHRHTERQPGGAGTSPDGNTGALDRGFIKAGNAAAPNAASFWLADRRSENRGASSSAASRSSCVAVPANDGGSSCFVEDGSSAARAAASKLPMITNAGQEATIGSRVG